jgi:hypothetical protein
MFPIPAAGQYRFTLKKGESGLGVYVLQAALNDLGASPRIVADGDFGDRTHFATMQVQKQMNLVSDGIAGPKTQDAIITKICDDRENAYPGMPVKLLTSVTRYESGHIFEAVNYQNYPRSLDLGAFQRRVVAANLHDWDVVEPAVNVRKQAVRVAGEFHDQYKSMEAARPTRDAHDLTSCGIHTGKRGSWELVVLSHNYPAAVAKLKDGHSIWRFRDDDGVYRNSDQVALWVRRLSLGKLSTAQQWCKRYVESAGAGVVW